MPIGFVSLECVQVWGERKHFDIELSFGNERNPLCLTWKTSPCNLEDAGFVLENPVVNISVRNVVDKMLLKESDLVMSVILSSTANSSTFTSGFKEIRDPIIPIRAGKY